MSHASCGHLSDDVKPIRRLHGRLFVPDEHSCSRLLGVSNCLDSKLWNQIFASQSGLLTAKLPVLAGKSWNVQVDSGELLTGSSTKLLQVTRRNTAYEDAQGLVKNAQNRKGLLMKI